MWDGNHAAATPLTKIIEPYCNVIGENHVAAADAIVKGYPAIPSGFTVKDAQVLVRHGARTPIEKKQCWQWNDTMTDLAVDYRFVKDGKAPSSPIPEEFNLSPIFIDKKDVVSEGQLVKGGVQWDDLQLTNEGAVQEYVNGLALKEIYFPSTADTNTIIKDTYVRHTDFNRTRLSAMHIVRGMMEGQTGGAHIEMHSIDRDHDILLTYGMPEITAAYKKMKESEKYRAMIASHDVYETKFNAIVKDENAKRSDEEDIKFNGHTRDCMLTQYCATKNKGTFIDKLFDYTKQDTVDIYHSLNELLLFSFFYENASIAKNGIYDYVSQGLRRTADPNAPKVHISTAHDLTIGYLLAALGGPELWMEAIGTDEATSTAANRLKWVPYAHWLIIETLKHDTDSTKDKVRVLVKGTDHTKTDVTHKVKGCETDCTLMTFCNIVKNWPKAATAPALDCNDLSATTTAAPVTSPAPPNTPKPYVPDGSGVTKMFLGSSLMILSSLF